jgi:septum formation protein
VRFRVDPSGVDESSPETDPRRLVLELARRKAIDVAKRHPGSLVLGADTLVVCAGEIIGKPKDLADAERILRLLNGRWQKVWTGVALASDGGRRIFSAAALSRVKARELPEEALRRLVGKHMDKAGAYAVQDRRDPLVEKIVGDRDNVTGLPMRVVRRLLARSRPAR